MIEEILIVIGLFGLVVLEYWYMFCRGCFRKEDQ
jgi:hypothetical protein